MTTSQIQSLEKAFNKSQERHIDNHLPQSTDELFSKFRFSARQGRVLEVAKVIIKRIAKASYEERIREGIHALSRDVESCLRSSYNDDGQSIEEIYGQFIVQTDSSGNVLDCKFRTEDDIIDEHIQIQMEGLLEVERDAFDSIAPRESALLGIEKAIEEVNRSPIFKALNVRAEVNEHTLLISLHSRGGNR